MNRRTLPVAAVGVILLGTCIEIDLWALLKGRLWMSFAAQSAMSFAVPVALAVVWVFLIGAIAAVFLGLSQSRKRGQAGAPARDSQRPKVE